MIFRSIELQLLIAPAMLTTVGLLTIFLAPRRVVSWTWSDISTSLAFAAIVLSMSLLFGVLGFRGDQVLLPVTIMLAGMGLLTIQRLQPDLERIDASYAGLAQRQLIYLAAGLAILFVTVLVVRDVEFFARYKYTGQVLGLSLMAVTFVFGTEINGARLWLTIGPLQFQPAEVVKIALVVFLAGYLNDKRDLLGWTKRIGPLSLPPLPYLGPMVVMWAASLVVLVALNDLGSALLFYGIFLSMLYAASGRPLYVVIGLISFGAASTLAYQLFGRVGLRVQNWLDPWQDPLDAGYQQIQSEYALASGGLFGSGLGMGQPWFIPEVQTDFVFSAIGEEIGLLGTLGLLALYFLLVMRGFLIALRARPGFERLFATGLATTLGIQTLIIIGGVTRIIPLTGITLPFVSYGGSSLLINFLVIGLLLRISNQQAAPPRPEPAR